MNIAGGDVSSFWWQDCEVSPIAPFDYPPERAREARKRVAKAGPRLPMIVETLVRRASTPEAAVRGIAAFVQQALMHGPVLQPVESRGGFWTLRRMGVLPARASTSALVRPLFGLQLVTDPEVLLALGEGRCGQCVALLCAALRLAGFEARPWQLPRHIVAEVMFDGEWRVIDADAFKNEIFVETEGRLPTRSELESNPYLVDRFKPTGWMFRGDSQYARHAGTGAPFSGYVDFYTPEDHGQISARYDAPRTLLPPGLPRFVTTGTNIVVKLGRDVDLPFTVAHAERASCFRLRCGRVSRGFSYDQLALSRLHRETSGDVFDLERSEPGATLRFAERGRYYAAAAAVPAYVDEFPSYVWWSDEVVIDMV